MAPSRHPCSGLALATPTSSVRTCITKEAHGWCFGSGPEAVAADPVVRILDCHVPPNAHEFPRDIAGEAGPKLSGMDVMRVPDLRLLCTGDAEPRFARVVVLATIMVVVGSTS